jgi:hypothetical protein
MPRRAVLDNGDNPRKPRGRAAAAPARGLWLAAGSRRTGADYPGFGMTSTAASAFAATCRAIGGVGLSADGKGRGPKTLKGIGVE